MKRNSQISSLALFLVAALFLIPVPAHAYLDPGTGSIILQVLMAGILGALFTIKSMWRNIKAFFVRITGRSQTDQNHGG